jgi:AAA domain-containing protein
MAEGDFPLGFEAIKAQWIGNSHDEDALDLGEWDFGDDNEPIPPRGWLLGNLLCRRFLSAIFADGSVGKTALAIGMALSLATGRSLIGEHVFVRSRVLIVCFEDGIDELRRRLTAAMLHHGISKEEVSGHLFVTAVNRTEAKLAIARNGEIMAGKLGEALARSIIRRQVDAIFLDPFVKTHSVPENDNAAIDYVVNIIVEILVKHDCAGCVPHHTNKGPADPGNANTGRGASAMKDAGRLVYTLTPMSENEAGLFGVSIDDRASLVRLDSGKVNLVRRSPHARWFKLVGVPIGNGTALYPHGDEIQTVERWAAPNLFDGLGSATLNAILTEIDEGLPDGKLYSDHGKATDRAAWRVITKHTDRTEPQARQIVKEWIKTGLLYHESYHDEELRKDRQGLRVQAAKRPGMIYAG